MQLNFDALYRSIVTSNTDTSNSGKIRVQCPQIAGLAEIRQAEPFNSNMPVPTVGSIVWIAFSGGDVTKPFYLNNTNYIYLLSDGATIQTKSLTSGINNDAVVLYLASGPAGTETGTTNPHLTIVDSNFTTPADIHLSGNVIKVNTSGVYHVWHNITPNTGWTQAGGGFQNLQYRLDTNDNLVLSGSVSTTSAFGAGTHQITGVNLASDYLPAFDSRVTGGEHTSSTNTWKAQALVDLTAIGTINVTSSVAFAIGDVFYINCTIPLHNIS